MGSLHGRLPPKNQLDGKSEPPFYYRTENIINVHQTIQYFSNYERISSAISTEERR